MDQRSSCPINLSVEILGDRWSLVVLRDIMFGNSRTYGELHSRSLEGIATNILADRLKRLTNEGLLSVAAHPAHRQRIIYSLTDMAIALVPVFVQLGTWGTHYLPVSPAFAARAVALDEGGPEMWRAFMNELRHLHLGAPRPGRSVLAELDAAFKKMGQAESGVAASD